MRGRGWEVEVSGKKAEEVEKVAKSLAGDMSKHGHSARRSTPWISGSFYLAVLLVMATVFLVIARSVPGLVLPIVIAGSLLAVSIVGAFQLRQDEGLSQKNFLRLMLMVFRQLPFLVKNRSLQAKETTPNTAASADQKAPLSGR